MKNVTLLAVVDEAACKGCMICRKVCPVLAVTVVDGHAIVDADACRGCSNCESRCPFRAVKMVFRDEPFTVGVDAAGCDAEAVAALCAKAHMNPEQILCYCTGVRADEVAAAILGGAKTPEEISSRTGIRTGCTIECIQPLLRLIEAAGIELAPAGDGWQWYGRTVTAWELPAGVKAKYNANGFFFDEDRELLERIAELK